jgi:galactokinase
VPDRVAAYAPGRVNLIGEHTDYNGGLCLPFAIERGVTVTGSAIGGNEIEAHALDLGESDSFALEDASRATGWRAFVRGAAAELRATGVPLRGVRLEISGPSLPRGAGLGSSAATCVALCLALAAASGGEPPDRLELARLCSRVENEWVGAQTGLLDQLAALFGRRGHALRLDMRDLRIDSVPLELGGWTIATFDSGAPRTHAASGYNERRAECRAACEALGIGSLREARPDDIDRLAAPLDRRVRHVLSETRRVERMVAALGGGGLPEAARLLDESHASLRDDYEVSLPAVEEAVRRVKDGGAAGARIVGGGFGGHVLALFPPGTRPPEDALAVAPGDGARLL